MYDGSSLSMAHEVIDSILNVMYYNWLEEEIERIKSADQVEQALSMITIPAQITLFISDPWADDKFLPLEDEPKLPPRDGHDSEHIPITLDFNFTRDDLTSGSCEWKSGPPSLRSTSSWRKSII